MQLSELVVSLTTDTSGLHRGLNDASGILDGWGKKTVDSISGFGKAAFLGFAGAAAAGLAGVGAGFGYAVNAAGDFEQTMANLQAVSLATDEQMQGLQATAEELGATTTFSANDVGDAMYYMSSAGFTVEQNIASMPAILDLAAASATDLATTANITANVLAGFGMKAEDAAHMADVLALASSKSNTNVEGLGAGMAYVAPVAAALGISLEETTAAMGLLSDAGIDGSKSGTALRTVLSNLAAPTGRTADAIEELGLNVSNTDGTMKPLSDIIAELTTKTAGMTDVQKAAYAEMLAGQEGMSALLVLMDKGEAAIGDYAAELENAGGTAQTMADIQLDTLQGSLEGLSGAFDGVVLALGQSLLPMFRNAIDVGSEFLSNTVQPMVQAFGEWLPTAVESANTVIADLMAFFQTGDISDFNTSLGTLAEKFGLSRESADEFASKVSEIMVFLQGAWNDAVTWVNEHMVGLEGAFKAVAVAIGGLLVLSTIIALVTALTNPVSLIIMLAGLLGMAWAENWGGIQEKTQMVIDFLQPYIQGFIDAITGFWIENGATIMQTVSDLWTFITTAFNAGFPILLENAKQYLDMLYGIWVWITTELPVILQELWNNIVTGWNDLKSNTERIVKQIWDGVTDAWNRFVAFFQPLFDAFTAAQEGKWYQFGENLRQYTDNVWNLIKGIWQGVIDTIANFITTWISDRETQWNTFGTNLKTETEGAWEKIWQAIVTKAGEILTTIQTLIGDIWEKFTTTNWFELGLAIIQGIINGIHDNIGSLVQAAVDAASAAKDAFMGFFGISSPSKLMMEMGKDVVAGLAIGMDEDVVAKAANRMADIVYKPFAAHDFVPTIAAKPDASGKNTPDSVNINVNIDNVSSDVDIYMLTNEIENRIRRIWANDT